ncbi:hypothetical protein WJX74_007203 [Apatococcus lobatus]|uniref:Protein kinase domain-containing protein n=1 Tax=Apatococcus lobatus TaxID=904363 RepID=A0AAW1RF32_9CHLO
MCQNKIFGDNLPATPAADVFSLGIVALETYLGHLPYSFVPFPPELLAELLPQSMRPGPARTQALKDAKLHAINIGLARLAMGSSIPAPGVHKIWDCLQTGFPLVDRLLNMCCHPDAQQRASAAKGSAAGLGAKRAWA